MSGIPQDMANLLAVAIRDIIWYKDAVFSFFNTSGVPEAIMLEVRRKKSEPTIKLVHYVLDSLSCKGDEGWQVSRTMLTEIYFWKDIHSVEANRKDKAVKSLKELQKAYKKYKSQQDYRNSQEDSEKIVQSERTQQNQLSKLDHDKLESFREEFDHIHATSDAKIRGDEFEKLMNKIFSYYCQDSKGSFRRIGEQIDGFFKLDYHWHYVEIRWRKKKASAADISVLRDRARDAFGGDTKALFVSINGFSEECLNSLYGKSDERVILMDGYDLRCVLDCQIGFDILMVEKQAEVIRSKNAFVSVSDIIKIRTGR